MSKISISRKAFEDWASEQGYSVVMRRDVKSAQYLQGEVQLLWEGYKECAISASKMQRKHKEDKIADLESKKAALERIVWLSTVEQNENHVYADSNFMDSLLRGIDKGNNQHNSSTILSRLKLIVEEYRLEIEALKQ